MIYALDANALITWSTGKPDPLDVHRLQNLFAVIGQARGRLVLCTPVLAEFFIRADQAAIGWLEELRLKRASVVVAEFDVRAAMECAQMHLRAEVAGGKRAQANANEAYQKIKVDRQIVAIALVHNAKYIVSGDQGLRVIAQANGLVAQSVADLPIPDSARQRQLDLAVGESRPAAQLHIGSA